MCDALSINPGLDDSAPHSHSTPRLVALCGVSGAGKDTVAAMLVRRYGFVRVSFAGVLKDVVAVLFGWDRGLLEGLTEESRAWRERIDEGWSARLGFPFSPRIALQRVGTDVFRDQFHPDIWVLAAESRIMEELARGNSVVVSDCRFRNEIDMLLRFPGAAIYHVVPRSPPPWLTAVMQRNGDLTGSAGEREGYSDRHSIHPSERDWAAREGDMQRIGNSGTLEALEIEVDRVFG
jgi:hypothetical protein